MKPKKVYQTKILVRYKGKYLLLKKIKDAHPDHVGGWEVPGGKIKPNEEPKAAGLRETKEETGLDCRIIAEMKPLELEKDGIKTITRVYLAEAPDDQIRLSDEHSAYIWVSYHEIDDLRNVIYRGLLKEYVEKAERI